MNHLSVDLGYPLPRNAIALLDRKRMIRGLKFYISARLIQHILTAKLITAELITAELITAQLITAELTTVS